LRKRAEVVPVKTKDGQPAVIDANEHVIGRLATHVAKRLLAGEKIVILNSEKARVTGSPKAIKARYHFKTHVGNERKGPFPPRMPHLILKRTVRGMLPHKLAKGRDALKRLTCHIGVPDEFKDAKAETIDGARKPDVPGMSLLQISQYLGKNIEVTQ
jgi:large subunit ribosomal protein L13